MIELNYHNCFIDGKVGVAEAELYPIYDVVPIDPLKFKKSQPDRTHLIYRK